MRCEYALLACAARLGLRGIRLPFGQCLSKPIEITLTFAERKANEWPDEISQLLADAEQVDGRCARSQKRHAEGDKLHPAINDYATDYDFLDLSGNPLGRVLINRVWKPRTDFRSTTTSGAKADTPGLRICANTGHGSREAGLSHSRRLTPHHCQRRLRVQDDPFSLSSRDSWFRWP
jgi:hypothetical protein